MLNRLREDRARSHRHSNELPSHWHHECVYGLPRLSAGHCSNWCCGRRNQFKSSFWGPIAISLASRRRYVLWLLIIFLSLAFAAAFVEIDKRNISGSRQTSSSCWEFKQRWIDRSYSEKGRDQKDERTYFLIQDGRQRCWKDIEHGSIKDGWRSIWTPATNTIVLKTGHRAALSASLLRVLRAVKASSINLLLFKAVVCSNEMTRRSNSTVENASGWILHTASVHGSSISEQTRADWLTESRSVGECSHETKHACSERTITFDFWVQLVLSVSFIHSIFTSKVHPNNWDVYWSTCVEHAHPVKSSVWVSYQLLFFWSSPNGALHIINCFLAQDRPKQ